MRRRRRRRRVYIEFGRGRQGRGGEEKEDHVVDSGRREEGGQVSTRQHCTLDCDHDRRFFFLPLLPNPSPSRCLGWALLSCSLDLSTTYLIFF